MPADPRHMPKSEQSLNGARYRASIRQTPHVAVARGRRAAIAVTSGAEMAGALMDRLDQGEMNAADAALTLAFGQIVASGGSWVGLSGILSAIVYDPKTAGIRSLDAPYRLPAAETAPGRIPPQSALSGRGVLAPGFPAGAQALHDEYGSLGWADILTLPIALAAQGILVSDNLATLIAFRADTLRRSPDMAAIFLPADVPLKAGETLHQPQLARLLERVAASGPGHLLHGDAWAEAFVQAARQAGGMLSQADLAANPPLWRRAPETRFGGCQVHTGTGLGGACLRDALSWLARSGPMTVGGAEFYERIIRASHRCYVMAQTRDQLAPGPQAPMPLSDRLAGAGDGAKAHSDVIAVAGADGMIVLLCHSINTTAWGELGLFVEGVALPDSASFQQRLLRPLPAGARVPHALATMIATRDGVPVAAVGAIGSSVSEIMLQTTVALLEKAQDPAEALARPQILQAIWPSIGWFQIGLTAAGLAALLIGALSALSLPPMVAAPVIVAALLSAGFSLGVVLGGLAACRRCIAALDRPRLSFWLAAAALCAALVYLVIERIPFATAAPVTLSALAALLLPVLLRGSLQPVNLILPGALPTGIPAELSRRGIALKEIATDPPFGYAAALGFGEGTLCAGVSQTSLDGGTHAR